MMETLTEFFNSFGWSTFILAVTLFVIPMTSFIYIDLKGLMSKKTFLIVVAVESIFCSTSGFGEPIEMIKGPVLAVVAAVASYLLILSWKKFGCDWEW